MSIENDYGELIEYAKIKIRNSNLSEFDLVNESFIRAQASNVPYSKENIFKYISIIFWEEMDRCKSKIPYSDFNKPSKEIGFYGETDRQCGVCNEIKTINNFSQWFSSKLGCYKIRRECNECRNKKNRENVNKNSWFRKNRERWNDYMMGRTPRKYPNGKPKKQINELWKKANKKYQQKQKEELTDIYIKSLLKSKNKNPTSIDILNKRKEIVNKRIKQHGTVFDVI